MSDVFSKSFTTGEADAYRSAMRRVLQICDDVEAELIESGSVIAINGTSMVREKIINDLGDNS